MNAYFAPGQSRLAPLLSLLCLVLPACSPGVDGNGDRVEETRNLAAFSRIRSNADLDVEVVQADQQSVVVSIDSNLQDLVKTRVSDGALYIDVREDIDEVVDGPHILVTVPELRAAKLDGSGRFSVELEQPALPFDLILSGSGDMAFRGQAAALGVELSGSGNIVLEGAASDVQLELSGSGELHARELTADSGAIELSGSGNVSATVQSSVSISLSGSGNIDLYGDATLDHFEQSGSGDVDREPIP